MASFTGFLTYLQFSLANVGTDKEGGIIMNESPFTYAPMSEKRERYTSDRIVEAIPVDTSAPMALAWSPVVKGAFKDNDGNILGDVKIIASDGAVTYANLDSNGKVPAASLVENGKVAYMYDNIVIPQEKLPSIKAEMKGITLEARARRIAVTYSQIAAFQAKQDYGIDFEATINKQAQTELQYQIDGEAIYLIQDAWIKGEDERLEAYKAAHGGSADGYKSELVTWVDANPDTISYSMRAEGFARAIEEAKMKVFVRTQKLTPTWMMVSPDIMPVLTFVPGFKGNSNAIAAGAYIAGDINGLKIICSPAVAYGSAYLGVLGSDGITATGVFAPYMPLVPTQLLGFADGTMTQGFSTLYDMKILNNTLVQKIAVDHTGTVGGLTVEVASSSLSPVYATTVPNPTV
jgi:hypothetical protein